MAKQHRNRKQRGPHRTATRPSRGQSSPRREPAELGPLIGPLRQGLRAADPTAFWVTAAPIVTVLEEPGELSAQLPDGVDLLQSFIDVDVAETTALLHMVAAMSRDDLLRGRSRRALTSRRQPIPPEVTGLSQARVTGTQVFGDGGGDNHLVELTLPGGVRATLLAYVARFPHLYLKDAFVMGERLDQVQERYTQILAVEGYDFADAVRTLDPAQTRASLEHALAGIRPDVAKKPEEGDQWPMLRPFVEFVLSLLPEGGEGYDQRGWLVGQGPGALRAGGLGGFGADLDDWDDDDSIPWDEAAEFALDDEFDWGEDPPWIDEDGTDLAELFLSSPQAADLEQGSRAAMLVRYLMVLSADLTDDPLVWDPDVVRGVLEDVLPTDPLIPPEMVDEVTVVLPALVAWAHHITEVDPDLTEAVRLMMTPLLTELPSRRSDPLARVMRSEALVDIALSSGDAGVFELALLAQRVGGNTELQDLDSEPLPLEQLDLDAAPDDVIEQMQEIDAALVAGLERVGGGQLDLGDAVLDVEFRTACRRFLTQVATRDASALRRRASARTTAVAVAWIVGRGNELVGHLPAPVRTGELLRAFGVKSTPSSRAGTLMRAAVLPQDHLGVSLGSPDLLVGSARAAIMGHRDRLLEDQPDA